MKQFSALLIFSVFTSAFAQDKNHLTISGISSGGFMAAQMGTIYSSQISGVGTVAGGFFYCAQNHLQEKIEEGRRPFSGGTQNLFLFELSPRFFSDVVTGQTAFMRNKEGQWLTPSVGNPIYQSVGICMQNPIVSVLPDLKEFQNKGLIDPIENMKSQHIYIYQGEKDSVVNPVMADRLVDFYTGAKVETKQIKTKNLPGGHNFPTDREKLNACDNQSMPYVSSCQFDLAEDMLQHLLQKPLKRSTVDLKNLYLVDQNLEPTNEALPKKEWQAPSASLSAYGYLYASKKCLENPSSCEMHVALHGCEMSDSFDEDLDIKYHVQVSENRILALADRREQVPASQKKRPSNDERKLSYGTLKFAALAGYAELADENNLMILFPQTWITSSNYPYNPKGCWDWFGATGPDYATNKGIESSWMIKWMHKIKENPKSFILSTKPEYKKIFSKR